MTNKGKEFLISCVAVGIVSTIIATMVVLPNVAGVSCPPRPRHWSFYAVPFAIPPVIGAVCLFVCYPLAKYILHARDLGSASAVFSFFIIPAPVAFAFLQCPVAALVAGPAGMILVALALRSILPEIHDEQGVCGRCGYNLAGNVSGVCPECRRVIAGGTKGSA